MPATNFYPSLSTLIPIDNIPDNFGIFKNGLTQIFPHLYYRDLQIHRIVSGESTFYNLSLLTYRRLAIEIPGTGGLALVLNPTLNESISSLSTEFPITLGYKWNILKFSKAFEGLASFDFSPNSFFNLILDISGAGNVDVLSETIHIFIDDPDPIQKFVDDFNTNHIPSTTLVKSSDPDETVVIAGLLSQLATVVDPNGNPFDIIKIIFDDYLNINIDEVFSRIESLFSKWLGNFSIDNIKTLLIPQASVSLGPLSIALEFPRSVLKPIDMGTGEIIDDENVKSQLLATFGSILYSTESGLEFLDPSPTISFTKSAILDTGITLEFSGVKLDLSRTKNIPEAIADGRPDDFVGVYIKDGTIGFPAFWNYDDSASSGIIKGRNLLIGTGGISGTIGLEAKTQGNPSPFIKVQFGTGFAVSLDAFSLTFQQNAITDSTIAGTLRVPGFKDSLGNPADIRIKVGIQQDGDFNITASEDEGFQEILLGNILGITLKSVYFGKKDDDFYIGLSGGIRFTEPTVANFLKGNFDVEKLLIWSDGRIEIEGGTIPLPEGAKIKIGPVEIAITALHFGSHQQDHAGILRKYRYFGFDGGVSVNPGGVDARGDGIKFYFTVDDDPFAGKDFHAFLHIQSIAIDLIIPGSATEETATALISGYLAIKETGHGTRYEGGVKFSLPKAKIAGGASMAYEPDYPAWIVDAFVELAVAIPLGATSLGIYGFRGLVGFRYLAAKHAAGLNDSDTWFQYYKAPPEEGVVVAKFEPPVQSAGYNSPFSVGAGLSLATTADGGKAFSMKLFLLLSLPELFYLEGKANILGERVGLTGQDPPFFAYLAISSDSVETGFGVDYNIPENGWILNLYAETQAAFFFQDPKAWYINFGREDNRTTARVLSIFDATAYLMLSAKGIAAGAGVTWGFSKSYAGGMVSASVGVYIEMGGRVSFERPQIGGFAMLGGYVDTSLLFFSFHIAIDTSLSVEAPKPFLIKGSVELCVGVTIGFWKFKKRIERCFTVEFIWEKNPNKDITPVEPFNSGAITESPPFKGLNILSNEPFSLAAFGDVQPVGNHSAFNTHVLPLDTWIDIEFKKGVLPDAIDAVIGGHTNPPESYVELIPPKPEVRQVRHEYSIQNIEIKAWNGSAWVDYNPYAAMSTPNALIALANADPEDFKSGCWQKTDLGYNKIRLMAQTPLSWMQQGQPGWYIPEQFGITSTNIFCEGKRRKPTCVNWEEVAVGAVYPDNVWQQYQGMLFLVKNDEGVVRNWASHFGFHHALVFDTGALLNIRFQEPCVEVTLRLTTFSHKVKISFFRRVETGSLWVYELIEERTLNNLQLLAPVLYADENDLVSKIEINSCLVDECKIEKMEVRLQNLKQQLLEWMKNSGVSYDELQRSIKLLEGSINDLKKECCDPDAFNPGHIKEYLEELIRQQKECEDRLKELAGEQGKACKEYTIFKKQFENCFPYNPSSLSFEFYQEHDQDKIFEVRFRIREERTRKIILSSSTKYHSQVAAEREMRAALLAASGKEGLKPENTCNKEFYFNVVDEKGEVLARRIEYFGSAKERNAAMKEVQTLLAASIIAGEVQIKPYDPKSIPCPVCLDHLDCWKQMAKEGAAAQVALDHLNVNLAKSELVSQPHLKHKPPRLVVAQGCSPILDKLLAAKKEFCDKYDDLYRALYNCNYKTLIILQKRCEELTTQLEEQEEDCKELTLLIKFIIQFLDWLPNGFQCPPKEEPCATLLHEICCVTVEDYQFNLHIPGQASIEEDFRDMQNAIQQSLTPIWRPDTKYLVKLVYSDKVDTSAPSPYTQYFGFRTAGPLGYYHEDANAGYVEPGTNPDQYALTGLRAYIDYQRSYPTADGDLVRAKPLFYKDSRLLVFYNQSYVYHMFSDWPAYNGLPAIAGNKLQVVVKDPIEDVAIENPPPPWVTTTEIPQGVVDWPLDPNPSIPQDILAMSYLRNPELLNALFPGAECWVSGGDLIQPASVNTEITLNYLKPLKLYTAIFNNIYNSNTKEVHRYVFQTSRYATFQEQVESYLLDDGKGNNAKAIFGMELNVSNTDIATGYDIVNGTLSAANTALAAFYADPFDRLIEGAWKITPLDAAVATEFNVLRQAGTGKVFAVWIRNPEPFNDPKIPEADIANGIRVMNGAVADANYKTMVSKDRSQAIVMNAAQNITSPSLSFRFKYLEWDGTQYIAASTVNVSTVDMIF